MLTYHASSVSDAESDIFRLLYCMNLSYCHIYNRTSWHTADCILKYAVLRILSEDTPSGRLYSIFRISYYSTLLLLYDIILPVYRHSGISGMSYDYHTFTGLFWHIFIIYPEIRHNWPRPAPETATGNISLTGDEFRHSCPHPAPETGHTDYVDDFRTAVTRYLQSAILFLQLSSGSVWVISELSECRPVAGAYPHPAQFTCRRILWGRTYTGTDWCSPIRTLLQNRSCQFPSYEIWYMIYIFQETGRQYLSAFLYPQDLISGRSHNNAMK